MARESRASKVQSKQHTTGHNHSALEVANAFVEQYYTILSHFPEQAYKFYREESIVSLPTVDGVLLRPVTTIKGIDEQIMGSAIKNSTLDLLTVHAQDTVAESVIVVVVGLLRKDNVSKCFSQTFLLAPQARGFYVLNDFFQFIGAVQKSSPPSAEEIEKKDSYASIVAKELSLTSNPEQASAQVLADRNSAIDKTIYVRDLPPHATRRTLTHAVKRFGSVKHRNIQIRGYPDGYRYAFVEFNNVKAARLALEAGIIKFDDWECEVESKKAHLEGL